MNTLGERIQEARKKLGINQKIFAQGINVKQGSLSKIESDQAKPSSETLANIRQNFNISLDWLLLNIGPMFVNDNIPIGMKEMFVTSDEEVLIKSFRTLSERQKGRVEQQIDNFKEENEINNRDYASKNKESSTSTFIQNNANKSVG